MVELVWVCESCYAATRAELADIARWLLSSRQLLVPEAETVWKALRLFEAGKADFSGCLIERAGNAAGCSTMMTFDRAAATVGMTLLR